MDTMTEDEIRNSTEFAEWITRYNKLNHADLTTKTAPYYLFVDYLTLISSDESETINELTAENAKLRAWIRDLAIDADRAADALRQKNEFSTGIALQLLDSSVKETAWLMSTLHLDPLIEPDYFADIERK